ncbi:M18 family aminopeptidase, partial [Intestinimonas butyriciproducens]|nr:M18 family aminopeptidase [Intestinimonas butyriciproducens]
VQELIDYIYASPTAYHAVKNASLLLQRSGFTEIKEEEPWNLEKGGKYFIVKNQSALIAFIVGSEDLENH